MALRGSEVIGEGRYHQGDSRLQTPVLSNPAAVSLIVYIAHQASLYAFPLQESRMTRKQKDMKSVQTKTFGEKKIFRFITRDASLSEASLSLIRAACLKHKCG